MAGVSLFSKLVTGANALSAGLTPLNIARTTSGVMLTNLFATTIVRTIETDPAKNTNAGRVVHLARHNSMDSLITCLLGVITVGCLACRVHPVLGAATAVCTLVVGKWAGDSQSKRHLAPLATFVLSSIVVATGFASLELMRWSSGRGPALQLLAGIGATTLLIGIVPTVVVHSGIVNDQ